jgi:hydrogenase/urease accessory protein HupE
MPRCMRAKLNSGHPTPYRSAFTIRFVLALLPPFAAAPAFAHKPDTSYVRVDISEDWINTRFTFDLDVLERVTRLDADGDGSVTEAEFRLAEPTIRAFLRRDVEFEVNEYVADFGEYDPAVWPENITSVPYAERAVTLVHFPFRKRVQELPESVTLVFHVWDVLGDRHSVLGTFHRPPDPEYEVVYTWAEPDFLYFTEYLEGDAPPPPSTRIWDFVWQGMLHIFIGYDHILFLLALIVVDRFRTLLKIITAFTVAHTITLMLAALGIVSLPSRLIESGIALTIMFVSLENLWVENKDHRWMVTFLFGLIHGFGFANVLGNLELSSPTFVRCLLSFNAGVELGQIAIVAPIWPLWHLVMRQSWGRKATNTLSIAIFTCGFAWFLDRALGLGWMPF